jgi:uncharacterized repeat protein (TIGR03803 family)
MSIIRKAGISIMLAALWLCASGSQSAAQIDAIGDAMTFTTLLNFEATNGANPTAGLIRATDGNLYGTTSYGGANHDGSVFKITPSGTLTTVYSFCSLARCADGANPMGGVIQATDGNFYGTTELGTIFKLTPSGTLTTLATLTAAEGESPVAGLVQGTDGNLYGTASEGGANSNCSTTLAERDSDAEPLGRFVTCGTVFKVTLSGTLTTLASLNMSSGFRPSSPLVQASDGNFYGTAQEGGTADDGTIFKITPGGTLTTLHSFTGGDGEKPLGALIQSTDGNLYGTTSFGGSSSANFGGTVFKITLSGTLTTLHSFAYLAGFGPRAGLVRGSDGNFYGTTAQNGPSNDGSVFEITPSGTLTTLHNFNGTDGEYSVASLVQNTDGAFYGTTEYGASSACSSGCGTVFSVSVGLAPFVKAQPTFSKVAGSVKILGNNLNGASSVSFNGAEAQFTVVSGSLIEATVPDGATSGMIEVVTPSGTLSSNVSFRVTP